MTSDALTQETPDQINTIIGKGLLCGSYDAGSTKRKPRSVPGWVLKREAELSVVAWKRIELEKDTEAGGVYTYIYPGPPR